MASTSAERVSGRSRLLVCAAALLFSTGGAAIKSTTLTGWQVASFRSGVAAIAVLALLPEARRIASRATWLVAVGYAGTLTCFVLANKLTTSANSIFLQSTAPLYLVLLAPWLLDERPRRRDLFFLIALAIGLSLFFAGTEPPRVTAPDPFRGNVVAVASGVFWAFTVAGLRWIGKREGAGGGSAAAAVAVGNLLAFAAALPFALPVTSFTGKDVVGILYLGIFQIGLAYVFLTRGLREVPALEASLLLALEPVLNPVWAWAVHGEVPSVFAAAGALVILAATVTHSLAASRARSSS